MIYYYWIAIAAALCWAIASLVSADVTRTLGGLAFNRLRLFFVSIMLISYTFFIDTWFTISAVRDKNRNANAATCKTGRPVSPEIFKSSAPAITAKSATLHLKYGSPYQVTARKTGAKTNVDSRRVSINTNDRTITFPKRRSVGLADQTQTRLEQNALS